MNRLLNARIEALITLLEDADDSDMWWRQLDLQNQEGFSEDIWRRVLISIHEEAGDLIDQLEDGRDLLGKGDEPGAWRIYATGLQHSESVFRECLELLGGLALRARLTNPPAADGDAFDGRTVHGEIYRLADALIRESAKNLATPVSFAIPALENSVISTMRRVARVRFPEWTFWGLPLVAYEYSYVAMDEAPLPKLLTRFVPKQNANDVAPDEARQRTRVLLAEALATYTLGPAYACSALLLRLQPLSVGTAAWPSDTERAAVILSVLEASDRPEQGGGSFQFVREVLADCWKGTLIGARGADDVETLLTPPIDSTAVVRALDRALVGGDRSFGTQGWAIAEMVAKGWLRDMEDGLECLRRPKDLPRRWQVRDALNGAWLARLGLEGEAERLGMPGKNLKVPSGLEQLESACSELCLEAAAFVHVAPSSALLAGRTPKPEGKQG